MKDTITTKSLSIVMLGATGAVGGEVLKSLFEFKNIDCIMLLGRREMFEISNTIVKQRVVDIFKVESYTAYLPKHAIAICTLGVGEPSKTSKENFIKIDKLAVLDFAKACKEAGVRHFELLASVGISSKSASFYLRTKVELVDELKALNFERLSIFKPSMILTPTNRYGVSQAITLRIWPWLKPLLFAGLRKYRGVKVAVLGKAIATNITEDGAGFEEFVWDDFQRLAK